MTHKKLTQNQLAEAAGVTQAAISKWLNGSVPKGDQLLILAKELGVTMEWLLTGEGPGQTSTPPTTLRTPPAKSALKQLQQAEDLIAKARATLES